MAINFSTTVAVDQDHLPELRAVWPTWVRHRPEIMEQPFKLLADVRMGWQHQPDMFGFLQHPQLEIVPVPDDASLSQRERMLGSLVLLAPWFVETPWLLKLDADTVAQRPDPAWCAEGLISEDGAGRQPVFVASGWNYTKPADAVKRLDDWADGIAELKDRPRLDLPWSPDKGMVVTKGRIISFVFFGRTDWLRWAAGLDRRLPVWSQDSFLWFVARRHGDWWRTYPMKRLGWGHVRRRHLEQEAAKALAG